MKRVFLLIVLSSCSYQSDNFLEFKQSPTIDEKLNKLTIEMQQLRRDLDIPYNKSE